VSDWRQQLDAARADRGRLVAALQEAGATIRGSAVRCPFHQDGRASGGIHEHGGAFWFTCQAGCEWNGKRSSGDLVAVLMKSRGLTFHQALAELGIAGPGRPPSDGNGAPSDASGAAGGVTTPNRATRPEAGDGPDAATLAAEAAARLQGDADALARLWNTRAIDAATARRFGLGIDTTGQYWTMPVRDGAGRVLGLKHHRIDPAGDGTKCFWLPKGVNSRHTWPVYLEPSGPVWFCPGELKALAVISAGRASIGVTGGESADLPAGLAELLTGRTVALAPDDDEAGRRWAEKSRDALQAALDVRIVNYGADRGAGLKDVGDVIVAQALDGKSAAAIGAWLDGVYEGSDPWHGYTVGAILRDDRFRRAR